MKRILVVIAAVGVLALFPSLGRSQITGATNYMWFATSNALPACTLGTYAENYIEVSGVTNNFYNGTVVWGNTPPGMYWSISILKLYGTPTRAGTYWFLLKARNLANDDWIMDWFCITVKDPD